MHYDSIGFACGDCVARITLSRPDRLNAFTAAMHGELADALSRAEADPAIRVLLLTGAGRGFCAGQDLGDRAAITMPQASAILAPAPAAMPLTAQTTGLGISARRRISGA